MIINSFDNSRKAIINPEDINSPIKGFPKTVITCFARETFNRILEELPHREIARTSVANLEIPIYELEFKGQKIGFFNAYVGASACVAILEDIIVFGMENLIVFGTCGVLDSSIEETSIIIPRSAIRDEGTSFHYSEASSEIAVNTKFHEEFKSFLDRQAVSYTEGKVWTTDGIYRETVDKMLEHKRNGAICVDMECSAIAALSKFRNINHFQFFYCADNLDAEVWEARSLGNSEDLEKKDKIAYIAMEFAIETF
ncbi:nucleoside phosphorylase [Streptococcus agalactiae]|uniref:nucleoside phosphorylase n=1 Tax=Streptococcus agalactiae TaxID=1311 RepID=UPI001CCBC431|nr:nucleoside phosphorylase [Streptococcus agalactiae]